MSGSVHLREGIIRISTVSGRNANAPLDDKKEIEKPASLHSPAGPAIMSKKRGIYEGFAENNSFWHDWQSIAHAELLITT